MPRNIITTSSRAPRGQAQQIIQDAGGYKDRTIAEAKGEAQQFISVLDAYKQAPAVTQRRMYIDAMETILQHGHKTVIDPSVESKGGIVPYLPLTGLPAAPAPSKPAP